MHNRVVHGVQGNRHTYQPVTSILCDSADPMKVARALIHETGCRSMYIADLDAIQGGEMNRGVIESLSRIQGIDLWVDAGISRADEMEPLFSAGAANVIIGTETLKSLNELSTICTTFPREKLILSLDMKKGRLISPVPDLSDIPPEQAIKILMPFGIEKFILLTLDGVGTAKGPNILLLTSAMAGNHRPTGFWITGGGVKTPDHLRSLQTIGIDAVLVATSLHNGWITKSDLIKLKARHRFPEDGKRWRHKPNPL